MVQPQPGCVNLRHAGRTNHHIYHHMTLRPYHSHHTLQKQVRRTTCSTKVALEKPLQRESNGGPAGRSAGGGSRGEPLLYGIPMKISSEWSHHLKSEPFIMPQFSLGQSPWPCKLCTWEDCIYTWPWSVGSICWLCTQLVPMVIPAGRDMSYA